MPTTAIGATGLVRFFLLSIAVRYSTFSDASSVGKYPRRTSALRKREVEERHEVVPGVSPGFDHRRIDRFPLAGKGVEPVLGRSQSRSGIDPLQPSRDGRPVFLGRVPQRVADEMNNTELDVMR